MAGEVADRIHVHPLGESGYLARHVLPNMAAGEAKSGRSPSEVAVIVPVMTIVGDSDDERHHERELVRASMSFYGSTPNYAFIWDEAGFEGTTTRIRKKQKACDSRVRLCPATSNTAPTQSARPSPPGCRDSRLFPNRIQGVNPSCPSGVSVDTCGRRRSLSGIRSLPAWASPSSQPSSRTGGRPRPSSCSPPRRAFSSCCNGGGVSRLQPIAKKQPCSTQPSASWTQPSMSFKRDDPLSKLLSRR